MPDGCTSGGTQNVPREPLPDGLEISAGDWEFWMEGDTLNMGLPTRFVGTGEPWLLTQRFQLRPEWTLDDLWDELFTTLQYIQDHELREQLTVNGERRLEPHTLGVTGPQKDWFVHRRSALKGY